MRIVKYVCFIDRNKLLVQLFFTVFETNSVKYVFMIMYMSRDE